MPVLLVGLFFAMAAAAITFMVIWPMPDATDDALAIWPVIAGTIGGAIGLLLAWAFRQLNHVPASPPKVAQRPRTVQIVGQDCSTCAERIMFVADGHLCGNCGRVFCRNCEPEAPCSTCSSSKTSNENNLHGEDSATSA